MWPWSVSDQSLDHVVELSSLLLGVVHVIPLSMYLDLQLLTL